MKITKYNSFLFILLVVYVLISLYTLSTNPLPWYDETYMASISRSFLADGTFTKQVAYYTDTPQIDLRFGPVYFLFTSLFFKLFGFGIFQYRIVAFLFGFVGAWLTGKILQLQTSSKWLPILLSILLLFDPFYFRSMREGRMDTMALSFILASVFFLLKKGKAINKKQEIQDTLFSGFFAAFAVLTTPRSGFLYFGIGVIFLLLLAQKFRKTLYLIALWSIPIVVLYSCWIFYAYGSYQAFYNFYHELSAQYTQAGNFYITIQKNQYLLIPISVATIFIGFFKYKKTYLTPIASFCIVSIISFYFLVQDPGPYSVFILPSYYLLIFILADFELKFYKTKMV